MAASNKDGLAGGALVSPEDFDKVMAKKRIEKKKVARLAAEKAAKAVSK